MNIHTLFNIWYSVVQPPIIVQFSPTHTQAQCSLQQSNNTSASEDSKQPDHPLSEHKATLSSEEKLRKLELELAQTKLALVESQCRNQELEKRLEGGSANSSSRSTRSSFLGRGKKKT